MPSRPAVPNQPTAAPSRGGVIAVLALLGATLFWAGNYVVGAAAVEHIPPLDLVFWRWGIALLPLLLLAQVLERPVWREVLAAWRWMLALALTGMLGYPLLVYAALEHTDPFSASLINAVNPALIALAAAFFLRERLTALVLLGVAVALCGALIVIGRGDPGLLLGGGFGTGERLMLLAIVSWTAYTVIGRAGQGVVRVPPVTAIAVQSGITVAIVAPCTLVTGGPVVPDTSDGVWSVLFLALFPSVLAYLFWNRALADLPAGGVGVFLNLVTVFVGAFTVLAGEPYSVTQVVGGLVVIAGVLLTNAGALRRSPPAVSRRRES